MRSTDTVQTTANGVVLVPADAGPCACRCRPPHLFTLDDHIEAQLHPIVPCDHVNDVIQEDAFWVEWRQTTWQLAARRHGPAWADYLLGVHRGRETSATGDELRRRALLTHPPQIIHQQGEAS